LRYVPASGPQDQDVRTQAESASQFNCRCEPQQAVVVQFMEVVGMKELKDVKD